MAERWCDRRCRRHPTRRVEHQRRNRCSGGRVNGLVCRCRQGRRFRSWGSPGCGRRRERERRRRPDGPGSRRGGCGAGAWCRNGWDFRLQHDDKRPCGFQCLFQGRLLLGGHPGGQRVQRLRRGLQPLHDVTGHRCLLFRGQGRQGTIHLLQFPPIFFQKIRGSGAPFLQSPVFLQTMEGNRGMYLNPSRFGDKAYGQVLNAALDGVQRLAGKAVHG